MRSGLLILTLALSLGPVPAVLAQSDVDAAIGEVQTMLKAGQYDEAVDRLRALEPQVSGADKAVVGNALGYTYYSAGRLEEAAQTLDQARSIAASQGDTETEIKALNNLGLVEFSRDNLTAAREAFGAAADLGSDYAREYLDIIDRQEKAPMVGELTSAGVAAFYKKDYDEALSNYSKALDLDPNNSRVLNLRGYVLLRTGDVEGATRDLERSVELSPDTMIPRLNLLKARCVATDDTQDPLPQELAPRTPDEVEAYNGDGELRHLCGDRLEQIL